MNAVSRTKKFLFAAMLPLVAAATSAQAGSKTLDDSMQACVSAFVSENIEKDRAYSLVARNSSTFDPRASRHVVALKATGKISGKKLAQATCIVDRNGISLTSNGKTTVVASAAVASR